MKSLAVASMCGLTLASCDQSAANSSGEKSVAGTWVVIAVGDNAISDADQVPIITINYDGVVQGTLGCNNLMSNAKIDADGQGSLRFGNLGTTKRLCRNMEIEEGVVSALEKVRKYSIGLREKENAPAIKDEILEMKDEKGKTLIEALKLGDNTSADAMIRLKGDWVIYSLGRDTISTNVTLPFIVDPVSESVNGHTGCNSFGGTIVLKGAHGVSFPAIATTKAMGDDEQNQREEELMNALNNTSAWKEDSFGRVHFTDSLGHTLFIIER